MGQSCRVTPAYDPVNKFPNVTLYIASVGVISSIVFWWRNPQVQYERIMNSSDVSPFALLLLRPHPALHGHHTS